MKTKTYENPDARSKTRTQSPSSEDELGRFSERLNKSISGKSARGFARDCGLSEAAVRKYLAGKADPSRGTTVSMARAAGVNLEWLATGEGPMLKGERAPVAPLDQELMQLVIEEVENMLADVRGYLEPEKKGKLCVLLYEEAHEQEGKMDRSRVLKLIKLAS
jgi:transcriptional regulator with XRE-family HTH domain